MNQFEMKQLAYQSNLKNRALQVLLYLIDRANKNQTCFPSVPTIGRELHISISTVKRAMRELVETGYVTKEIRFREGNRGQTSNLYTLFFPESKAESQNENSEICQGDDAIQVNSKKMKKETITKAIDYLRENGDDQVFISFYGGEPLIAFDSMKYAIDYATKNITEKELHFGFTTNLTLMTKEKAEYLVRIPNLHIVCSIDGPEEIHNMNRVYAGGGGTYRDVVRGLKFLKEALTQVEQPSVTINFNAVYMVPYKREKLEAIDMLLNEFCKITKNSTYIITYPTSGTIPKEYDALIPNNGDSSMWEWMADIARECEDLEEIKARGIVDSLITVHNRTLTEVASGVIPMNACCIPGTRRLYIDTEGDMYVCERINKSPKIGNVNSGIDINTIMSKYYYEYSDKSIKYCANCWAAKMCPFCYADRMTENGISDNAHLHCAEARNHLKKQFSLYHEILENNPQKLEVLNKYEIK